MDFIDIDFSICNFQLLVNFLFDKSQIVSASFLINSYTFIFYFILIQTGIERRNMEALCETEKQLAQSIEEEKNNLEELPEEVTKAKEQKRNKQAVLPSKVMTRQRQKKQQIQQKSQQIVAAPAAANCSLGYAGISAAMAKLTTGGRAAKRQKQQMGRATTSTIPSRGKQANMTSIIPDAELPQWEPQKQQQQICDQARDVLVDDPLAEVQKQREILKNLWTDKEKAVFIEKIALYGTDFAAIAKFLPNKTVKECQHFYYMTKEFDLNAKIRALEENAEQKAKYQTLEAKFAQMLSTQNEQHQQDLKQLKDEFAKKMAQLETQNRKLEEKLESTVEVQTTKMGALEAKVNEFPKMLTEQQKQMSAQFQASLEQKLKEAEQRAQMEKNQLEEIIRARASQQKMEKFREEMYKNGQQTFKSSGKGGGMAKLTTGGPDAIKQKQQMGTTTSAIPSRGRGRPAKITSVSAKRPYPQQQEEQSSSSKLPTERQGGSQQQSQKMMTTPLNLFELAKQLQKQQSTGPNNLTQSQKQQIIVGNSKIAKRPYPQQEQHSSSNKLPTSSTICQPPAPLEKKKKKIDEEAIAGKDGIAKLTAGPAAIKQKQQKAISSNLNESKKIFANPKGFVWAKTAASISQCGLKLKATNNFGGWVFATEGYAITGEHCRKENFQFPGTILYYYEVTTSFRCWQSSFGFTDGSKPPGCVDVGNSPNSYGLQGFGGNIDSIWISGKKHKLDCLARGNVIGSGLLLNAKNELAVFFTVNGILRGNQIRINPTVDRLYPTVNICSASVEANFGDNLVAKPFRFDTVKCPGLVFE